MRDLFASKDAPAEPHFRSRGLSTLDLAIADAAFAAGEEGCTLHDFMAATGEDKATVSPRFAVLVRMGVLRKGTKAQKRRGPTRQKINVWFCDPERDQP